MTDLPGKNYCAFRGHDRLMTGPLPDIAEWVKKTVDNGDGVAVLVFDDSTGAVMDLDLRGSLQQVRAWAEARQCTLRQATPELAVTGRGRGRPKLGVVPREVTLLPRHWAWLAAQRGGASATLRRLVDEARKSSKVQDRVRMSQDATYMFMSALAGDLPGYEEAIRALYAGNKEEYSAYLESWPVDVRAQCLKLASPSFSTED